MAKLANIFSSFGEIAQPLDGARVQNYVRSISFDIWAIDQVQFWKFIFSLFFTQLYRNMSI